MGNGGLCRDLAESVLLMEFNVVRPFRITATNKSLWVFGFTGIDDRCSTKISLGKLTGDTKESTSYGLSARGRRDNGWKESNLIKK